MTYFNFFFTQTCQVNGPKVKGILMGIFELNAAQSRKVKGTNCEHLYLDLHCLS